MPTEPVRRPAPPGTQPMDVASLRASTAPATAVPAFVAGERFAALREQLRADPVSRDLAALVYRQADAAVAAGAPLDYKPDASGFLLTDVRRAQGRILSCALAYRLTDKAEHLEAARRELVALAALPDWCPQHFLDAGEASLTSGLALRWLGDALAPADRDAIARAIVRNALRPSLEQQATPGSWVIGDFNWNPVCHGGLTVGALAVADREPALSRQIVERAIACLPHAAASYAPDGAFPEGPSYWSYGTTYYVLLVEALRASRGDDAGLAASPGFLASADFMTHVRGATGEDFGYADYYKRRPPEAVMLWFAREMRRPDLADAEAVDVRALAADPALPTGEAMRFAAFALLWWDPTLRALPAAPRPLAWIAGGAHAAVAAFRTAWQDPRATYLAIKGGTPDGSHAHMDVGGFVMESDGVRWAIDLGSESYDKMRAAGLTLWNYGQDSTRWTTFRCGVESHNVLRFDGARQRSAGFGSIAAAKADVGTATLDLATIYADATTAATRTATLHADRSVTIADAWTAGPKDVDVAWQWMTRADVTVAGDGVTLRQAGESLTLRATSDAPFTVSVDDVSAPRGPMDSPNPGVRRITIALKTPANARGTLSVRATPGAP